MGQVLTDTPYDALTSPIAGIRILLREAGGGLQYLGAVKEPKCELKTEFAAVIDAASGAEVELRKVASVLGITYSFTASEFLKQNIARFMMSQMPNEVAADLVATNDAESFVGGAVGTRYGLANGRQSDAQRAALTVYGVTGAALLVLDTDYRLVQQYGWTFIELLSDQSGKTLRAGEGMTATEAYHYLKLAHSKINPLDKPERQVSGVLQIVSKTGQNMEHYFDRATLSGGGNLALNSKEFSTMDFKLDLQDNSAAQPTAPFGELRMYGYKSEGGLLI